MEIGGHWWKFRSLELLLPGNFPRERTGLGTDAGYITATVGSKNLL